jgi:peptidoglycan/LPS O-acetylase OafA/YrhL
MTLARLAVPGFFAISGYFAYKRGDSPQRYLDNFLKCLKIALLALAVLTIIHIAMAGFGWYEKHLDMDYVWKFLFFNAPPSEFAIPLWFLFALSYVHLLYYFILKIFRSDRVILVLSIVVYVAGLFIGPYESFGNLPIHFDHNFLIPGLTFFSVGYFLHKYQTRFMAWPAKAKTKFISLSLLAYFTEMAVIIFGGAHTPNLTALMPLATLAILMLAISLPNFLTNTRFPLWGSRYALYIYLTHFMIMRIMLYVLEKLGHQVVETRKMFLIYYASALLLSFAISAAYYNTKKFILSRPNDPKNPCR